MEGLAVDVGMPAQVRESAGEVVEQCDRLSAMLTTMLEIAEINAGVLPLAPCPVDFCELVREASDLWGPVAEDRGLDLSADVPDRPVVVAGNLSMLQRVVANLVDNAIKYSEPGGRIALTLTVEDSEAVCRVSDTGTGIADEDRLRIFDRFYRCDASRASPGHGLGLPLALAIVRAHGGSLSVRSGFGEGSCFTVTVPLASV
jgi:signal transduction histidine kinase